MRAPSRFFFVVREVRVNLGDLNADVVLNHHFGQALTSYGKIIHQAHFGDFIFAWHFVQKLERGGSGMISSKVIATMDVIPVLSKNSNDAKAEWLRASLLQRWM